MNPAEEAKHDNDKKPSHEIIDNREEILLEHVKTLLRNSVSAKFAVGYFFTCGLDRIEKLRSV